MSNKRARYDRIALVERAADEEDESSEEEDEEDEQEPEVQMQQAKPSKITVALRTGSGVICHVCGQRGHKAGFVGAVYVDCPNKPCYLCKQPGHTTATCPHNMTLNAATPAAAAAAGGSRGSAASPAQLLLRREQTGQQRHGPLTPPASPPWQIEAAILKLHSRRVCCLAFPDNSDSHVLSGDKKGQVAVWNFMQVHDRTIYSNIHRALVNSIRYASWLPGGFSCASASSDGTVKLFDVETAGNSWLPGGFSCASSLSDGTVKLFDTGTSARAVLMLSHELGNTIMIETGSSSQLLDLNPQGWSRGCTWHMFYGADVNRELRLVLAGDSDGKVHLLDPRAAGGALNTLQLHKPGSKVNSVAVNPAGGASVVLTAGNDHTAKLFDVRKLSSIKPPASEPLPSTAAAAALVPAAAAAAAAVSPSSGSVRASGSGGGRGRGGGSRSRRPQSAAAAASEEQQDHAGSDQDDDDAVATPASGRGRGRGARGRGSRGGRSGGSRGAASPAASPAAAAAATSPEDAEKAAKAAERAAARARSQAAAAAAKAAVPALLSSMPHGRVVNHAVFSRSGRQILTTCQDNRLHVWSNLLACDGPPTREIVHSHDFNRYLTPFKAEWFPSDPSECRIICGRYISEDFGGVALHPVDIIDAASGRLLQQLTDLNLNTITPVNLPHPRLDLIISGSSRSLYKWVPQLDDDDEDGVQQQIGRAGSTAAAAAAADLVRRAAASSSSFVCVDAEPGSKGSKAASGGSKTVGKTKQAAAAAGTQSAGGKRKAAASARGKARGGSSSRQRKKGPDDRGSDQEDDDSDDSD